MNTLAVLATTDCCLPLQSYEGVLERAAATGIPAAVVQVLNRAGHIHFLSIVRDVLFGRLSRYDRFPISLPSALTLHEARLAVRAILAWGDSWYDDARLDQAQTLARRLSSRLKARGHCLQYTNT